jgi:predicted metal-binding membrane protein
MRPRPVALTERAPAPTRTRLTILGAVLGAAGLTGLRMAGMDAGPGTDPGSLGFGFLRECWRDGRAGALRTGVEHGVWCLGR